ncbi:hypothetical protein HO173_003629 [Letharia columbiana]|uniref:Autophagy-related protein 14 n=1 Tax=Letharia columbiana TaxID=112416 RepID=A0A8H6G0U2_9LECA|nr:uncharacterized protein HO173_003629 [Letharia columbiana]KAF6238349.1 hypothetical protein HO173_003629 [Letharia columbiana]
MSSQHETKAKQIGSNNFHDVKGLSRERPWLLPSNRKLRHLLGISLRNLTLSSLRSRTRRKTLDDEFLPHALKTPAKLLSQRENKLEYSRSSSDLKSPPKANVLAEAEDSKNDAPARPKPPIKPRRRSTLNWTNAPPSVRQTKLEDVARERMADTWFSLHYSGIDEPIYVSEVIEKAMNPSFRFFDLNVYGPAVTRLDELTVKYWAKTENMDQYVLLVELQLCFRSLQFIGKSLESFHHPLPQNCILFHLSDGIYTSFTDLPLDEPVLAVSNTPKQPHGLQPTSSFDALMRLSNLDDCIQDALSTREKLASQISHLLEDQKQSSDTIDSSSQAEQRLASTNRSLTTCRKQLTTAQTRRSELQASLKARRNAITSGDTTQQRAQTNLASAQTNLSSRRSLLQTTKSSVSGQIRRICEDLLRIYPIEPIDHKPLSFTIRNLHLPNAASPSTSPYTDPAVTAAALGIVAHVTYLLSFYISAPLPYPPTPHGSTSTIFDPISTNMQSHAARTFPLYEKGAVTYRFEYGVFLLNSDIELLMSRQGSRMVDQRHTLPNLKYLLTVLTAGKGELPVRKKGGAKVLENGSAGEQEAEKSPLMNGKQPYRDSKGVADETQNI